METSKRSQSAIEVLWYGTRVTETVYMKQEDSKSIKKGPRLQTLIEHQHIRLDIFAETPCGSVRAQTITRKCDFASDGQNGK